MSDLLFPDPPRPPHTMAGWNAAAERAARERDAAIERVERNADEEWLAAAARAITDVAATQHQLTTEDVWALLQHRGVGRPREGRAMGAAMRSAHTAGTIEPTDAFVSGRSRHRAPIRVWRSQLLGPA